MLLLLTQKENYSIIADKVFSANKGISAVVSIDE